jgi:RNA polymerase sigma-70 factor, ECF subfamily
MAPHNPIPKPERMTGTAYGNVVRLPVHESDAAIVASLRSDPERGRILLYDRYAADIDRTIARLLGPDPELTDLLHDVFVTAISSISALRDDNALGGWLMGIAVYKVRRLIRRRKIRRVVQLVAPYDLDTRIAFTPNCELSDAVHQTYRVLSQLPTEDRIAFTLRRIGGMELSQIAQSTGVSVATVKRRIARAQCAFVKLARQNDALAEWLEQRTLQP